MINGKVITVVMPAYNAEQTLRSTYNEIPFDIVDNIILVDDASSDNTSELARKLGIHHVIRHDKNKGYGGNQKTCYNRALEIGSDIVCNATSRLSIHPSANHVYMSYDSKRALSCCNCIAYSGQRRSSGRNAAL